VKSNLLSGFGLLVLLAFVTSAPACPPESKGSSQDQGSAAVAGDKPGGCQHKSGDASLAGDKAGGCAKKYPFAKPGSSGSAPESPVEVVLASMPSMKYRVGTADMCCSKTAEETAAKTGSTIQYVVADKAFESKIEANVALAALLEAEVDKFQTVQFSVGGKCSRCPIEAKELAKQANTQIAYRVGGFDYPEQTKAEMVSKLVVNALGEVKMSYKVGDASFCCDKMAGAKAKETGKAMTFVVGKDETCCQATARLMLAQAKLHIIIATAAAALAS